MKDQKMILLYDESTEEINVLDPNSFVQTWDMKYVPLKKTKVYELPNEVRKFAPKKELNAKYELYIKMEYAENYLTIKTMSEEYWRLYLKAKENQQEDLFLSTCLISNKEFNSCCLEKNYYPSIDTDSILERLEEQVVDIFKGGTLNDLINMQKMYRLVDQECYLISFPPDLTILHHYEIKCYYDIFVCGDNDTFTLVENGYVLLDLDDKGTQKLFKLLLSKARKVSKLYQKSRAS